MATERLSMHKAREILRLKWAQGRSHREITRALGVGLSTISETASRATLVGLDWAGVEALGDDELEARLYPPPSTETPRALPDPAALDLELRRVGVTLRLLHHEYLEANPGGYGYTQFCEVYRQWRKRRKLSMRQEHKAGDKLFVDYSGKRPAIVDPTRGERVEVELFVAVLGASNYTYAEATRSQQVPDWIASHTRTFEFLGGVTAAVVPDQLKSGVTRADRYEPGLQRSYEEMGRHYDTAIIPARPAHPRDKAKVEVGVQIAQRWILARLRNQTFFSLDELNARIRELLDDLNARVMRRYGVSRRDLFERLDRPALRPLPAARFICGEWKRCRAHIDYHVELDHHFYSVPYQLVGEEIWVRATAMTIEAFHKNTRVGSHVRSYQRGGFTTDPAHRSVLHQKHAEWSPERLVRWAGQIGVHTAALVERILTERKHPEHGYRSCLGIIRLEKKYGGERLDAACARALAVGGRSYSHVASILRHRLDRAAPPEEAAADTAEIGDHENVRGPSYYH
jgi:transposase